MKKKTDFPHYLSVTLNDELRDKLLAYCSDTNLSKSKVVRYALTSYLNMRTRRRYCVKKETK